MTTADDDRSGAHRGAAEDDSGNLALLWPPPQTVRAHDGVCSFERTVPIDAPLRLASTVERFATRVRAMTLDVEPTGGRGPGVDVSFDVHASIRPQGYRLEIDAHGAHVRAMDDEGAFYGLCTLEQLLRVFRAGPSRLASVPFLTIEDWPEFSRRGVLFDISRTKVPTKEALFALVDWIASLKLNELQLYTEHTFAYRGHEIVWQGTSALTGADICELDAYARARHVDLVPNQQSFGHLHQWLKHDRYRALAELPEGIVHAFSLAKEPYGLCPVDPASTGFLAELYDELLPHFTSRFLNVGLDETVDLGLGRSKNACRERGVARVYADFLREVHGLAAQRGRRMQFFGDFLHEHREVQELLPRDVVVLEWGYEADYDFELRCQPLAAAGLEFYVCPGTSSWQSVGGRTRNGLRNLERAARAGAVSGASGYLVTDWGDRGHLQPFAVSQVGLTAGAGSAWNTRAASESVLADILDTHTYADDTHGLGELACGIGNAYLECASPAQNGSALFFLIAFAAEPLPHARMPALTREGLERALAYLLAHRARLPATPPTKCGAALVARELAWSTDVLCFACRLGLARLEGSPPSMIAALAPEVKRGLARELAPLIAEHRALWGARNRPGGLAESSAWLERVLVLLA